MNDIYGNSRQQSHIASLIAPDKIINSINSNFIKLKNIFRFYIDKYKNFQDKNYLNINKVDSVPNSNSIIISKLIEFDTQLKTFINLNSQHPIQNINYPQMSRMPRPIMTHQPQQSYFSSYFNGGKKTKSKYIKTKKVYKIGNKKYIVYLGSRGAKYIKKDKKYISIKSL